VAIPTIARLLHGQELPDLEAGWRSIHAMEPRPGMPIPPQAAQPQPPVDKVLTDDGVQADV